MRGTGNWEQETGNKEPLTDPSPFRRTRVLLALGPFAGTLGGLLGLGLGWNGVEGWGEICRDLLDGRGLAMLAVMTFLSLSVTLGAAGLGLQCSRPFHAWKSSAVIGGLIFGASWWFGRLAAEWASC